MKWTHVEDAAVDIADPAAAFVALDDVVDASQRIRDNAETR